MARTGPIHILGVVLIFAASICLLITTITAPVVNSISIFRVDLQNQSSITFGTFGYCVLNAEGGNDWCTGRHIGYRVAHEMALAEGTGFSEAAADTADGLTNVMVLHPIACGLAFIAFLISAGAGFFGSLVGAVVAFVAWVVTLVVMATNFAAFGIVRNDVNDDNTSNPAYFGSGQWTLLAAFLLLFFGMLIVLFTCCSARRQRRRDREATVAAKNDYGVASGQNRWYRFRRH